MTLGFKEQFAELILTGRKQCSIRQDPNKRWNVGKSIQFYSYSRTKKKKKIREDGICKKISEITIIPFDRQVRINENYLTELEIDYLSFANGFESVDLFFEYFNNPIVNATLIEW